ncbi:MAG: GNAT family N-acetyltransferase [Alphaproteobacteria bacterium]|nr:GNAT family N-acetyltransferase [Alphaproteobacteria bacterium]
MLRIRHAVREDTPLILDFIRQLAEYEKLSHEVIATEQTLSDSLFCDNPKGFCVIAEWNGAPVAFALYFYNFSTFLGKTGIYLEDLFVKPEMRGKGIGKSILKYLAQKAKAEGCGRLEWWVLDWNTPSIEFYKSLGAVAMDEWTVYRVTGKALDELANS